MPTKKRKPARKVVKATKTMTATGHKRNASTPGRKPGQKNGTGKTAKPKARKTAPKRKVASKRSAKKRK